MVGLLIRLSITLILLALIVSSSLGLLRLWKPSKTVQVRNFNVLHEGVQKEEARFLAELLADRITRIDSVLSNDLSSFKPPGDVRIESVIRPELRLAPDITTRIDAEFKPFEFDIAGVLNSVFEQLHNGPVLRGTAIGTGKDVEIIARYSGPHDLGPWAIHSEKGAADAVETLAYAFVLDSHREQAEQLNGLTVEQFRSLLAGLTNYQQFVKDATGKNVLADANPRLQKARELLQELANQKVACSFVYSYLGSVSTLIKDNEGAKTNFEQAIKLQPSDKFSQEALERVTRALSLQQEVVTTPGSLQTLSAQPMLSRLKIREALDDAKPVGVVKVAVIATGITQLQGMQVGEGSNFTTDPVQDQNGHGTQVASLIAAIAPNTLLMPIKVLRDNGTGTNEAIIQGIDYATEHGARIIVLPLGGAPGQRSSPTAQAIRRARAKGVLVVAAAGNDGSSQEQEPASIEGVFSVGATDEAGRRASFSNFGPWVKAAAPGVDILVLSPKEKINKVSGTSLSCAVAAGIAALVWSVNPQLNLDSLVEILSKAGSQVRGEELGAGLIDAQAAIRQAQKSRT
jgi:subtilisin family serine protease